MINQSFNFHVPIGHAMQEGTHIFFSPVFSKLIMLVPLLDAKLFEPFADDAVYLSRAFKLGPMSRRERL